MVTAALGLFAAHGVAGTSIRDIAHAAGVTEGALYRHFAGKDELALELFGECARMLYEHLRQAVDETLPSAQQLCRLARAFADFAHEQPEAYEYVMARHYEHVGELPPDQPLPKDIFVEALARGVERGEVRPIDVNLAAAMLVGLLMRTVFFIDRGMVKLSREEALSEVCGAVQRVFLNEERGNNT